jgi:hypothetical protein
MWPVGVAVVMMISKNQPQVPPLQRQMPGASGFAERSRQKYVASMAKGGPVKKTGMYMLHKGEVVVPASVVSGRPKKAMGKDKMGK